MKLSYNLGLLKLISFSLYLSLSANIYANCDTSRSIIDTYYPRVENVITTSIESKRVQRTRNDQRQLQVNLNVVKKVQLIESTDYDYVTEQLSGYRCKNTAGSGNSLLTDLFKNGQQRTVRLKLIDENIVGAGPKSAQALVWYFEHNKEPQTWAEFEVLVNQAIANEKKKKSTAALIGSLTKIITTHSSENKKKLGLSQTSQSECQNQVPVCISVYGKDTKVTYGAKRTVDVQRHTVNLNLSGVSLLPSEQEVFDVTLDKYSLEPIVTTLSQYGDYSVSNRDSYGSRHEINLRGIRNRVTPPRNNYTVSLTITNSHEIMIKVTDHSFSPKAGNKTIELDVINTKGINEVEFSGRYRLSEKSANTYIAIEKKAKPSSGAFFSRNEAYIIASTLQVTDSEYYNSREVSLTRSNSVVSPTK